MDAKGIEPYSCWNWRRKTLNGNFKHRWAVFKIFLAKPIPGRQNHFAAPVANRDRINVSPIPTCGRNTLRRDRQLLNWRYKRDGLVLDD